MTAPTPPIPTFVDGQLVHAAELNALSANIMNLFNENQGGFRTQRPCVIARQTTAQGLQAGVFSTVNFQESVVNTDNMWVASRPDEIVINTPGIYYVFSQLRFPVTGFDPSTKAVDGYILMNGRDFNNSITGQTMVPVPLSIGTTIVATTIANLASGSTLYLGTQASFNFQLDTGVGGSFLGALFLTPSS
ncbi:MAG: hypothetical protein QJR12_16900 [Mycobacterium sp.]|uniref:hypothetical protein n=1 Tax=Mycobacterium sp. TaxID=1785 RepID=UPI0026035767|nr:hypothetical protein [Mycobacterium sp.]MDI3315886.1 hypothetical protein [Mycobacterium sp.]